MQLGEEKRAHKARQEAAARLQEEMRKARALDEKQRQEAEQKSAGLAAELDAVRDECARAQRHAARLEPIVSEARRLLDAERRRRTDTAEQLAESQKVLEGERARRTGTAEQLAACQQSLAQERSDASTASVSLRRALDAERETRRRAEERLGERDAEVSAGA